MIEITQSTLATVPSHPPRAYSATYGDIQVRAVYDTSDRPSVQFTRSVTRKPVEGSTLRTSEYGVMTAIGVEPLLPLFDADARLWIIEFMDAVKALEVERAKPIGVHECPNCGDQRTRTFTTDATEVVCFNCEHVYPRFTA